MCLIKCAFVDEKNFNKTVSIYYNLLLYIPASVDGIVQQQW
jgi:uncharacterized membrane protein